MIWWFGPEVWLVAHVCRLPSDFLAQLVPILFRFTDPELPHAADAGYVLNSDFSLHYVLSISYIFFSIRIIINYSPQFLQFSHEEHTSAMKLSIGEAVHGGQTTLDLFSD